MTLQLRRKHPITPPNTLLPKETATDSVWRGFTQLLRPACGLTAALLLAVMPGSSLADDFSGFRGTTSGSWSSTSGSTRSVQSTASGRQSSFQAPEASASDRPVQSSSKLQWRPVRKAPGRVPASSQKHSDIQLTAGESEIKFSGNRYSTKSSDPFRSSGPATRFAQSESRSVLGAQDPFEADKEAAPNLTLPDEAPEIDREDPFPRSTTPPTVEKVDPFGNEPPATRPTPGLPTEETEETRPVPRTYKSDPMPGTLNREPSPSDREAEANSQTDEIDCEAGRRIVQAGGLDSISLSIYQKGRAGQNYPDECPLWDEQYMARCWAETTYTWKASALCHKPLYFEDVQLERYGHEWGPFVQPVVSAAHFFGTLPILPYKMGLETPDECVYALGYYRPNSCAPYMIEPIGFTWRAALFEAGAVVGAAAVLP